MKLSKKTDYALRVLFTLVEHWGQGPVSMTTLARRNDVPKRFLEHIMLELKKHNVAQIIISHRLQDIFAVGDRVMVLKRGENVGERRISQSSEQDVLEVIVSGRRETAA